MPIRFARFGRLVLVAGICLSAAITSADAAEHLPPRGPPPEAVQACSGKSSGDACEVAFGDRSEAGTCAAFADGTLACRPARPPPHRAPPEAIKACAGESEGAACAVTLGGDTLDGSCTTTPEGEELACRPSRMPPPPDR